MGLVPPVDPASSWFLLVGTNLLRVMCDSWPEHPQKVGTDHPARKNCKNEEPQKIHLNWLLCFSILQPMLQHTSANFLARFTRAVLLRCDLLLV